MRDRSDTDDLLLRLERKQLLHRARRSTIAGDVEFSFTHALIREVAYSQLPRHARAQRHERAAGWLEQVATDRADTAELIAHHYTTALELQDALGNDTEGLRPAALTAFVEAARRAATKHDHAAVIRYTETALALRADPSVRAELLMLRAVAGDTAGKPDESQLLEARDAAIATGRAEDAVHLTYLLNEWAEYYAADAERAIEYETQVLRLAADLPPGPIATLPAYIAAYHLVIRGRYDETIELANTEIERAIAAGSDVATGLMLIWRGKARADSGDASGIDDLREAVRILDEHAHPKASLASYNLGDTLQGLGRLHEASDAFEAAVASAHRSGNAFDESTATIGLAMVAFQRGEPTAALAMLDRISNDPSEWTASKVSSQHARLLLADAPHDSAQAAHRQLAYARGAANPEQECDALAMAARAELAIGDDTAANASLDEYLKVWTKIGGLSSCSASLVEAALALAALDRHQELTAAADLLRTSTPWTDAAHALGEHRYTDAAAILDSIPSIPLRDAALGLADDD